ncbi:MAG: PRC-barrel domain-containing protein [Bacteroidota bacterium]|nr:PRC-barrel domain-containing protein [Bacteroidota bacterium]
MLQSLNSLIGYKIHATDGFLGKVDEFFFDDEFWVVRYIVVDTGGWLSYRKVLISPVALGTPDWKTESLPVNLTCEQVRNSPDIDTKKTIFRQHEIELFRYYTWPYYWGNDFYSGNLYGINSAPPVPMKEEIGNQEKTTEMTQEEQHLRSTNIVSGYHIHAKDGDIGHVDDFIIDQKTWTIQYLVAKTRNWLPGKTVLISPKWLKEVSWIEEKVIVDLTQDAIRNSPEYDPSKIITEEYEAELHKHYGWFRKRKV